MIKEVLLTPDVEWNAGELGCGEILMHLRKRFQTLPAKGILKLIAIDSGAPEDLPAWCALTGHNLLSAEHPVYFIQKRKEDG